MSLNLSRFLHNILEITGVVLPPPILWLTVELIDLSCRNIRKKKPEQHQQGLWRKSKNGEMPDLSIRQPRADLQLNHSAELGTFDTPEIIVSIQERAID